MNAKALAVDVPEGEVAPWVRDHLAGGGKEVVWTASSTLAMLEEAGWRCTGFTADGMEARRWAIHIVMERDE